VKPSETISVGPDEFDATIRHYVDDLGYRLDMIMPADEPVEALLSKPARKQTRYPVVRITMSGSAERKTTQKNPIATTSGSDWTIGRAGMMYRDLIPNRLDGLFVASHIRIVEGGEVPDSVHYHKIDFQIIYCLKGAIRVVYEAQGDPFWLRPGDCVLQPPEVRHRVLEAEAGSEVIEVTSPATHETWFDHELQLPTANLKPHRIFGTKRFVRHRDADAVWKKTRVSGSTMARTEMSTAGPGTPEVYIIRAPNESNEITVSHESGEVVLKIVINGKGIKLLTKK
jgi:quercetin dioxygenase-like cupin family protein